MIINQKVLKAIQNKSPIIALESAIITHGMPYPQNVETAIMAEQTARDNGVTPATIAIKDGKIRIGLNEEEIEELAKTENSIKASRRDVSFALSHDLSGGTTVAATMLLAHQAGIKVFATGGIGGVHRGSENTFDISADLMELSQTPIIIVSAGAKAILDLPKTLEVLETLSVPVIGYQTKDFPAFYSRESGLKLEMTATSQQEIALMYEKQLELGFKQGILVANPIPKKHEIPREEIEKHIDQALTKMKEKNITGKEVTPFLLSELAHKANTLEANIRLLENNVKLACEIGKTL